MNIQTMQMNPNIARVLYKEYRRKVREHRDERLKKANQDVVEGGKRFRAGRVVKSVVEQEDQALMESYRAMARGQRIVNVASVMHAAGLDKQQLPKLALAGAHWKECYLTWSYRDRFEFSEDRWAGSLRGGQYTNGTTGFPLHTFTANLQNQVWRKSNNHPVLPVKAVVPSIPLHLRPSGDLREYHILFEPVWAPAPPVDPILLKHVHGYMYAVLAQWDLTDIERSVLEGRIT
jgi:hypothetical protein